MNRKYLILINASRVKKHIEYKRRVGLFKTMICLFVCTLFFGTAIDVNADAGRGAASGAAIGGFLGLVFGEDLGDVVEGAAVGAGAGAIGGAVSGSMKKKEAKKRAKKQSEQEQRQKEKEKKTAQQEAANDQQQQEQELIKAIGEDNYRGLLALVDCEHKRAQALAKAGAASSNPDHKLSSIWLEALIASDLKQKDRTDQLYQQLVSADRDIDTPQQASIEADKVLMDVRGERRSKGVSCR